MKKVIRILFKIIGLTIALPFTLIMALGYWAESKDDVTYFEAFKKCL